MPNAQQGNNDSQIANPITGAMSFGLVGALVAAIGASIRDNSVHDEAMTVLVGGVIVGAMAGTVGCCTSNPSENASACAKFTLGLLSAGIALTAFFTSPMMGELILDKDTNWDDVIIDEIVGGLSLTAGALGAAAVVGGAALCANAAQYCSNRFFASASSVPPTESLTANKQAAPTDDEISTASNRV